MNAILLLVGREEESGPEEDQVSSPATLRMKWQEEEEGLRLVCGEVGRAGVCERMGWSQNLGLWGSRRCGPRGPANEGHPPSLVPECSRAWFRQPRMKCSPTAARGREVELREEGEVCKAR